MVASDFGQRGIPEAYNIPDAGNEEYLYLASCMGDEAEIHMDKCCPLILHWMSGCSLRWRLQGGSLQLVCTH